MIDLYSTAPNPTHNVYKIVLLLEELGLPYQLHPINVFDGEQFSEKFLKISPNNKVPAIVDNAPADGGEPIAIFESGSIMVYLADKAGRFIPPAADLRKRTDVLTWMFWQVAGLGPNLGQLGFFNWYAKEKIPSAIDRFSNELDRLFGVLDTRLAQSPWVAGNEYTVADMINFSVTHEFRMLPLDFDQFPHFVAWHERIKERPAYNRAYIEKSFGATAPMPEKAHSISNEKWDNLYRQTAQTWAHVNKPT